METHPDIPRYALDTDESYLRRIAVYLKTLPKYVYLKGKKHIDLLKKITKNAEKSTEFIPFLQAFQEKYPDNKLNVKKDILEPWLAYLNFFAPSKIVEKQIFKDILANLLEAQLISNETEFNTLLNSRSFIKRKVEQDIRNEDILDKKYTNLYQTFESIEEGRAYTDFKIEVYNLRVVFQLPVASSPLDLFNLVLTSENMPFCTCNNYYKVLRNFDLGITGGIPEKWITQEYEKERLYFRVNEKKAGILPVFTDVIGEIKDDKLVLTIKRREDKKNLTEEELIERCRLIFVQEISFLEKEKTSIAGHFFFPQTRINPYVLADMITLNPIFSSLMAVDEKTKATKKKSAESNPWLYTHFVSSFTGELTASITQKNVNRTDPEMKWEDVQIFPHGTPYVKIRVKANNIPSAEYFQNVFSKLIEIYFQNEEEVTLEYKKFIPEFGIVKEYVTEYTKRNINLLAPKVFTNKYSRYCSPVQRIPSIVTPEEAKDYEEKGYQVMVFPRDKGYDVPYPSDGVEQFHYVCLSPEYPYPGLRKNKLENKEDYPFVPCCFNDDQRQTEKYKIYFEGKKYSEKDKKQQVLIITDKMLGRFQYGTLPKKLNDLFNVILKSSDGKTDDTFIRMGVTSGPSSFLGCVMFACMENAEKNKAYGRIPLSNDKKEVLEERKYLSDFSVSSKQNMYDYSVESIKEMINSEETYFNPRFFLQLLCTVYQCNIILFTKEGFVSPRSIQGYYSYKTKGPTILVYENIGSESERADIPQCELIIRWNKQDRGIVSAFKNQDTIEKIKKLYDIFNTGYRLQKKIEPISFPILKKIKDVKQTIDPYGKCRRLQFNYEGVDYTINTEPLPPLNVEEIKDEIKNPNLDSVLSLIEKEGVKISYIVKNGYCVGVKAKINQTICIFSIEKIKEKMLPENSEKELCEYPLSSKSFMETFNVNRRNARYLVSYVLWLFSSFLREKEIQDINDGVIEVFAKENFILVQNFTYPLIGRFLDKNQKIFKEGKLIVESEDMKNRLLYVLKLYSKTSMPSLLEYYKRTFIPEYYLDLSDFTKYENQNIFQDLQSLQNWSNKGVFSDILYEEIQPAMISPYILRLNEEIFLAQNANSLESAFAICVCWNERGYNPGYYTKPLNINPNYTLYVYTSKSDIKIVNVKGLNDLGKITLAGYKSGGVPLFTCLLKV